MAKSQKPVSQPDDENLDEYARQHPLLRNASQVDDIAAALRKSREAKEFQIEEVEKWKDCVKALAASPNGKLFLKSMLQFAGYGEPANIRDTMRMVETAMKSAFYLKWVKPFLTPEVRSTIE